MKTIDTRSLIEGNVKLLVPDVIKEEISRSPVFFNPKMEMSRDLCVVVLQSFQRARATKKPLTICDVLSGIGSRGIRLIKEVVGINKVIMNDHNILAIKLMKKNIIINGVDKCTEINNLPANLLLERYSRPQWRFDYIDIDPFGSPVPYIDSAVRALKSGGLISVTATDLAPLSGIYPKVCFRKYGGISLRTEYSHESALRIVVATLCRYAAVHGLAVKPVLCYYHRHYLRVYAQLFYNVKLSLKVLEEIGFIAHCKICLNRINLKGIIIDEPVCDVCGGKFSFIGPLWLGRLNDKEFLEYVKDEIKNKVLNNRREIEDLIDNLIEESEASPTFYLLDTLCKMMKIKLPKPQHVIDRLKSKGYLATRSHIHRNSIKTEAGINVIKDIVKELSP